MKPIPTQRHSIVRAALWFWDALERHPFLPMAIVLVLLILVNYVEQAGP
jgi:hypothetical protein